MSEVKNIHYEGLAPVELKSEHEHPVTSGFIEYAGPVNGSETYVELAASDALTETVYVSDHLPEGYTMVIGEDGQQYVTIVQDNQTYAIPLAGAGLPDRVARWYIFRPRMPILV
jgi:hypothetical protein